MARLVEWGATKKQVADLLHLDPKSVDGHVLRIDRKLGELTRRAALEYERIEEARGDEP